MARSLARPALPRRVRSDLNARRRLSKPKVDLKATPLPGLRQARRKFLSAFPDGFRDETYLAWERDYKWQAHSRWRGTLAAPLYLRLLRKGAYGEIAKSRAFNRIADQSPFLVR